MDVNYDSNLISSGFPYLKNIKKSTMSETYQCLSKLIRESPQEMKNLNEFLSLNTSLPLFEERLLLFVINVSRLESEVVKILLSQNDYQISRVLGFQWFFRNLSSEFCIKELFPFVSVSVRCKIINGLSKNLESTEEAEKYFEFIRNKYGNERANYLLPRCSPEFILSYFSKVNPTFEHNNEIRIFLNICKRHPEIGAKIFSTILAKKKLSYYECSRYKKVIQYLSGNHPDLIVPFVQEHYSCFPYNMFGIKLTKKLGSKLKGNLSPDLVKSDIFRETFFFSILNFDERVKFLAAVVLGNNKNLTFDNWINSSYKLNELLKLTSPDERLRMIESVFQEVYQSNFSDHSKCWTCEILELLPTSTRQPYVRKLEALLKTEEETELEKNVDVNSFNFKYPEKLVYLYDSTTAFEKFKEIIRKCPAVARRESIVSSMVKNCSINKDVQKLQEVVEFIATRHRNDDYNVITSFANAIHNHFHSSKLTSVIFDKLDDLTYFLSLKPRSSNSLYAVWKKKHVEYLLDNNMEVNANSFFESVLLKSNCGTSFAVKSSSKQLKKFILAVCDEALRWIRNKSTEKLCNTSKMLLSSLVQTCREFNEANKSNRILVKDLQGFEEIIKRKAKEIWTDLEVEDWPLHIWEMVFASERFGSIINSYYKPKYLCYIIKRNPELIEKQCEGILNTLFSDHLKQFRMFLTPFILTISFWEKTEKVKEIILNEFKNGDGAQRRKNALELYSRMCTIEEFSTAVENYLPKVEKVEKKSDVFDEIQILIPSLIRNIKPRWKNFELIMKFFFGDFLKIVIPSFSVCCYHTRCDVALSFLKNQLDSAPPKISHKKDIIKLIVELSDREERSEFFPRCWDENTHYSIRTILLSFVSKSFLEFPSRESFRVLEKCVLESDEITIASRPSLTKIPNEFFSDYVLLLWRFSEGQEHLFRNDFRRSILCCFDEGNINLLSVEFCETIIRNYLFNSTTNIEVEAFTVLFLVSERETVKERVNLVLDLIKTRKPNSESVFQFLNTLVEKSKEKPTDFAEVFDVLLENWPEYPLGVLFEERILLTYYSLHYKVIKRTADPDRIPVEFGKELKILFSKLENLSELTFIYAETLKRFFQVFKTFNAIVSIKELLTGSPGRALTVLAILSLPSEAVVWHKAEGDVFNKSVIAGKKVLNEIFKNVENCNDPIVEIYMRSKFDFVKFE